MGVRVRASTACTYSVAARGKCPPSPSFANTNSEGAVQTARPVHVYTDAHNIIQCDDLAQGGSRIPIHTHQRTAFSHRAAHTPMPTVHYISTRGYKDAHPFGNHLEVTFQIIHWQTKRMIKSASRPTGNATAI